MPSFDFIAVPEFRQSLESDHAEMQRCVGVGAWKSVQVLAGSIVEALLVDYLLAANDPPRSKDPLRMDLAEAVTLCKEESVVTARTADLSAVVRSYRNLIHPGRAIRLGEDPPNEKTAQIAAALVDLIIDEVARFRRTAFGLTAEQIVSKVERDQNSIPILRHLMTDVAHHEQERLLAELIPERYMALEADNMFDETAKLNRLQRAFRIVFDTVTPQTRTRATERFVRVLKEGDGELVTSYGAAFFKAEDLEYVEGANRSLVKQHLLSSAPSAHTAASGETAAGLAVFLETDDVTAWLDPYIRALLSRTFPVDTKNQVRIALVGAMEMTKRPIDERIDRRIDQWIRNLRENDHTGDASVLEELKTAIGNSRFPF